MKTTKLKMKWFTLLEMLIVMIIIWILAVVLTESYISISRVALKIEQERDVSQESLMLTQIIQSLADNTTIDYDRYGVNELEESKWYSDELYLKDEEGNKYSIYKEWDNCLNLDGNFPVDENWNPIEGDDWEIDEIQNFADCKLILKKEDKEGKNHSETIINTLWKVVVSKVKFRIIPYNTDNYYFNNWDGKKIRDNLHQPAFWMWIHIYARMYQPTWTNKIDLPLQLFFNLKNIKEKWTDSSD